MQLQLLPASQQLFESRLIQWQQKREQLFGPSKPETHSSPKPNQTKPNKNQCGTNSSTFLHLYMAQRAGIKAIIRGLDCMFGPHFGLGLKHTFTRQKKNKNGISN